jgi:DNA-binding CsgD family transcriptional regulator
MNHLPEGLGRDLANLLTNHHAATRLYRVTVGLLGDQILPAPREASTPAMLDTNTIAQLVRAYARQGQLGALAPVLELIEPYLPVLRRSDPLLIDVPAIRLPQPRGSQNPAVWLTSREIAVLVGMANGMTNLAIAKALGSNGVPLSEETVKTHGRTLRTKLQARDRAHAVRRGYDTGILPLRAPGVAAVAS